MGMLRRNGRARVAFATATAPVRVAAYGRVSTEAQADKEFSSVEVQRLAAERYVELHADEGWTLLPERFEDPGYSGSNIRRPGLERLFAAIAAGQVDVVIVQRFDRLSRSMLDFLNMLETFKRRNVSFVSVSQRFDTSTPVGEMTLNILLSFAQFERQIIGERTRDKIQAARRHGRWTGGMPPLGYDTDPKGGRLVVNQDEADQVRAIFELYIEHASVIHTAEELNRRGWRRKSWTTKDGTARTGKAWDRITTRRLLTDPIYTGMQKLGNDVFQGEHPAIVTKALFQRAQRLLDENRSGGGSENRNRYGGLLRGLLRCGTCGSAMGHAPTTRRGRVYRYYRCLSTVRGGPAACPTRSISADKVETFVVNEIKRIGSDPELQAETFRQAIAQVSAERRGVKVEGKRIERAIAAARQDVQRLVATLSRTTGPAGEAVRAELEKAQASVTTLDARLREVRARETALAAQHIDEADLARTLEAFDPIWEVLLTPERERVLRLLIERVTYNGAIEELKIQFRLGGIAALAGEVGG